LGDLVGVAGRMNSVVEVMCWDAALGLQLGAETGVRKADRKESVAALN